jgi:hypothetical protein
MIAARSIASFALLVWFAMPAPSLADTVFTDGTFDLSGYTSPFTVSSGPMTDGMSQCSSCGNPGFALSTLFTLTTDTSATSNLEVGLLNTSFTYTPSTQGAIASIDASVDNSTSDIMFTSSTLTAYNEFLPLIEQDGNYYDAAVLSGPGNVGFVNLSTGALAADDFTGIDTTTGAAISGSHPNFAGDTLEFGLIDADGSIALPSFTQTIVYDNLVFDVAQTPEPGSLVLMSLALAVLVTVGRTIVFRRLPS